MATDNKKIRITAIVLGVLLLISVFFNFNGSGTSKIDSDQIKALKFQRDSIITFNGIQSKAKEKLAKQTVDSLLSYNKYYVQADSINKITIYYEKKKLSQLTRSGRDRVRDSIFRANNLPNSPR